MDDAAHTAGQDETSLPAVQRNVARQAKRRVLVYLDEIQRRWIRSVEADALRDGVRLSTSGIVRLAIDELRIRHVSWRDLAGRLVTSQNQELAPEVR